MPFGFFLPGDSLLVTAGLLVGTQYLETGLFTMIISLSAASFLGYIVGYYLGLFAKEQLLKYRWVSQKRLDETRAFYRRYRVPAIIISKYFPLIRTFFPIAAGVIKSDIKVFLIYNALGSLMWVMTFVGTGYVIGTYIPGASRYLGWIVLSISGLLPLMIVFKWIKKKWGERPIKWRITVVKR